jgi:hypothetical protein
MRIGIFAFMVPTLIGLHLFAQGASIEIEADPVPFAFRGYALNAAYAWDNQRAGFGLDGAEVPESLAGNSGWTTRYDGAKIFYDYFFACETAGWFIGGVGQYVYSSFKLNATGAQAGTPQGIIGGRIGYRYNFTETSGIYIAPWLGISYTFGGGSVTPGGQSFEQQRFGVFPGVLVGWTFWDAIPGRFQR